MCLHPALCISIVRYSRTLRSYPDGYASKLRAPDQAPGSVGQSLRPATALAAGKVEVPLDRCDKTAGAIEAEVLTSKSIQASSVDPAYSEARLSGPGEGASRLVLRMRKIRLCDAG
jgi:hypothetical protein